MPPRESLTEYPEVPIYERRIFDGRECETPTDEHQNIRQLLAAYGQQGCVLVEVSRRSQSEDGYQRGPGPGDSKAIVVRGLFRDEVVHEIRIGKYAFRKRRREQKAVMRMAKLIEDKRKQTIK